MAAQKGQKRRKLQRRWTNDALVEEAKKYKTRLEWATKDNASYCVARRRGILDKCASHMIKAIKSVWYTDQYIINIAKKYRYLKDFREKEVSAYAIIIKRKMKEKACSHMIKYSKARELSDREIIAIGDKYKLKSQWRIKDFSSFNEAGKRGLFEKTRHCQTTKGVNKTHGKGKNKKIRNE